MLFGKRKLQKGDAFLLRRNHIFLLDKATRTTRGLAKYGRTETVFQLLYFNLATYPAGRYKFSQVQIINIKL